MIAYRLAGPVKRGAAARRSGLWLTECYALCDSQRELEDLQALEVTGQAAFANFRHTFLE
jgi:hypothetical protein